MKEVWWERFKINLQIKEYSDSECSELLGYAKKMGKREFQSFIISNSINHWNLILSQVASYCRANPGFTGIIIEELFEMCLSVNPGLRNFISAQTSCGGEQPCQSPKVDKKRFEDVDLSILLSLGERIKKRVIGQDQAIDPMINAIKRASAGMKEVESPIGSFFFTGPSGVGKTLSAEVLCDELIGDRANLIKLDCSEFRYEHEYAKLIGSPHGFKNCEQGGIFTNAVLNHPFSIILFDEIEKAHECVHDILLQVMDRGTLMDSRGIKCSFSDTIIIMTSNIGVSEINKVGKTIGFGDVATITNEKRVKAIESALKTQFKPEFLNRIDEIIHFFPLSEESCRKIVKIELSKVLVLLLKNKGIKVDYSKDVEEFLLKEGFSTEFGARPLKRCIKRNFINPLADFILQNNLGNCELEIYKEDHIKVRRKN